MLIRREDVGVSCAAAPLWLTKNLSLDTIRREVETMEVEAERFYVKAAEKAQDVGVRRFLGDLAEAEKGHEHLAATGPIRSSVRTCAPRRTKRAGACSCCNMYSRVLPD